MTKDVDLNGIYQVSEDVVARDVHGEFIIIPITSGIGDLEDVIFTLNETGRAIWERLDGQRSLNEVVEHLSSVFDGSPDEVRRDVVGIVSELVKRKMLIER